MGRVAEGMKPERVFEKAARRESENEGKMME